MKDQFISVFYVSILIQDVFISFMISILITIMVNYREFFFRTASMSDLSNPDRFDRLEGAQVSNHSNPTSSGVGRGDGGPKPPKKKWKKIVQNHILKYQKFYTNSMYGILFFTGLDYTPLLDLDLILLKDLLSDTIERSSELYEISDNLNMIQSSNLYWDYISRNRDVYTFIDSQFSDILRVKSLIERTQLNLSAALTILGFHYNLLDPIYVLQGVLKYSNAMFNSNESMKLFLVHYLSFDFLSQVTNSTDIFKEPTLKAIKNILSSPLHYDIFFNLMTEYTKVMSKYDINEHDLNVYFILSKLFTNLNNELEEAVLVYKKDLMTALKYKSSSIELTSKSLALMSFNTYINVLHGLHKEGIPECIVTNSKDLSKLKWACFYQALRTYYELHVPINSLGIIKSDSKAYLEFYKFYIELATRFNSGKSLSSDPMLNLNFIEFYHLINSFDYSDLYGINEYVGDIPTTISLDLESKMAYVKEKYSDTSLESTVFNPIVDKE